MADGDALKVFEEADPAALGRLPPPTVVSSDESCSAPVSPCSSAQLLLSQLARVRESVSFDLVAEVYRLARRVSRRTTAITMPSRRRCFDRRGGTAECFPSRNGQKGWIANYAILRFTKRFSVLGSDHTDFVGQSRHFQSKLCDAIIDASWHQLGSHHADHGYDR